MLKTLPSIARGVSSIPGQGDKIPDDLQLKNKTRKQKQYCNKFNKKFLKWSTSKKSLEKH